MRRIFPLLILALVGSAGCGSREDASKDADRLFPGVTLRVAAVGDSKLLSALKAWSSAWERQSGGKIEFLGSAATPGDLSGAQVVVYPAQMMGELVDRNELAILHDSSVRPPVPLGTQVASPDPLAYSDIATAYREQVSKWGVDRMGLPLGGSGLVVVFNRAAFDSEAMKKAAAEAGVSLGPPKTWDELDALAKFLNGRDWDGDGQAEAGIVAALGSDPEGLGDDIFLARSVALGQHPDHYGLLFDPDTLEPRVASPPFVEALSAIVQWKNAGPEGIEGFDASAARKAFREGRAALLIDRAEQASAWTAPKAPATVGVAPLPASNRVFDPGQKVWQKMPELNRVVYLPNGGGWLAGLSRTASGEKRKAAIDLVRTICGPEVSWLVISDSEFPMLPARNAQLSQGMPNSRSALGVDSGGWSRAVAQTVTAPRVVPGLRIPGASEYLQALSRARRAAIAGTPAEEALKGAVKDWASISESRDVARQLWHYRRSLNKLVTDLEPPARSRPAEKPKG